MNRVKNGLSAVTSIIYWHTTSKACVDLLTNLLGRLTAWVVIGDDHVISQFLPFSLFQRASRIPLTAAAKQAP